MKMKSGNLLMMIKCLMLKIFLEMPSIFHVIAVYSEKQVASAIMAELSDSSLKKLEHLHQSHLSQHP